MLTWIIPWSITQLGISISRRSSRMLKNEIGKSVEIMLRIRIIESIVESKHKDTRLWGLETNFGI